MISATLAFVMTFGLAAMAAEKDFVLLDPLPSSQLSVREAAFLKAAGWKTADITMDEFTGFIISARQPFSKIKDATPDAKAAESFIHATGEFLGVRPMFDPLDPKKSNQVYFKFRYEETNSLLKYIDARAEHLPYPEYAGGSDIFQYDFSARLLFDGGQVTTVIVQQPVEMLPEVTDLKVSPKYTATADEIKKAFMGLEISTGSKSPKTIKIKDYDEMKTSYLKGSPVTQVRRVPKGKQLWVGLVYSFPLEVDSIPVYVLVSANTGEVIKQESPVFY